ncbi:MAG TPA: tyrosine-type recombinase/integrase [Wenzhouxiangellaceae bacterium]|nr:tyrosine-type recombinase/integrase [Wenzhouxiangellaceae bacterium]
MSDSLTRMRIALRAEGVDEDRCKSLLFWARAFLTFCNNDDPERLDRNDVEGFLAHASEQRFAGRPSRNRALEAIEWLFRSTPDGPPAWLKILIEERRRDATPNILSQSEVRRLLAQLKGGSWLAAALIYGTGIRLLECVRLRVQDIDLIQNRLTVRDSAGKVTRRLPLPENIQTRLQEHLEDLRLAHIRDIVEGNGSATLPPVVAARSPNVARNWGWQYLFPQRLEHDRTGAPAHAPATIIHHVDPQTLHRKFERAALDASIYRRVTGHVLRNSFALHMIQRGVSVKRVERILGTRAVDAADEAEARSLPLPSDNQGGRVSFH